MLLAQDFGSNAGRNILSRNGNNEIDSNKKIFKF